MKFALAFLSATALGAEIVSQLSSEAVSTQIVLSYIELLFLGGIIRRSILQKAKSIWMHVAS